MARQASDRKDEEQSAPYGVERLQQNTGRELTQAAKDRAAASVKRDAMHEADYGSRRGPEDAPLREAKQGGVTADAAAGGGRTPTAERDRDYDPDGDRQSR